MAKTKKVCAVPSDGIYAYLGPTITGVIQRGTIYRGTRDSVLSSIGSAIAVYPQIEQLIVADTEISNARKKIASGDNVLSNAYKTLSAK